jgi:7-cyano-7-deazaguanine synthase
MSIVVLSSGGVDSTLVCVLSVEAQVEVLPLFVDYGQLAAAREWQACHRVLRTLNLPAPKRVDVRGYGKLIPSGLTNSALNIRDDAFLPGRNLLLLTIAASYALSRHADGVAIGLLDPNDSLFPDQTPQFLDAAQNCLRQALGRSISVVAPLLKMSKRDVLAIAKEKGIKATYSCHQGGPKPCNKCVSCLERIRATQGTNRR